MRWCPDGEFLAIFLHAVFSVSRVQHVSDPHPKFALRPHHVWKYGIDIQSATAENRRGKKTIDRRQKKKPQDKNIMSASAMQGGHKKLLEKHTSGPGSN